MADPGTQLSLLRRIFELCEAEDVPLWLLGGWGIDALLGRVTRAHDDIDLVTAQESRSALRSVVAALPGRIMADETAYFRFQCDDVRVDVRYFQRWQDGLLVLDLDPHESHIYPTPPDSFPPEYNGYLPDFHCRSVSWAAHYFIKAGFYHTRAAEALRDKDQADLALIAQHLSRDEQQQAHHYLAGVPRSALS